MNDLPPSDSADLRRTQAPNPLVDLIYKSLVIAEMDVRKLRHDFTELLTRAIQPMLWLLLFGEVMARSRTIPTGGMDYLDFLAPGILAQSVLFVAIFYGIDVIWERDMGVLYKLLASPTPRTALVLGKALAVGARALSQLLVVFVVSALLGVNVSHDPLALLGLVAVAWIGAALFSTFSLIIACIVKTRERFMGIGQVLTMPLFFASNAIYPIAMMPAWLQAVAHANPLSYQVDALRALMLADGHSSFGLGVDFAVLLTVTALLIAVAARMYPRLAI
ncbi:MAG: ABC transporter permease [Pseudomonadota bacterium]